MGKIDIEPWEPEETVGKLWHAFASRLDAPEVHHGAAVGLSEVGGRLAVLFRGLGGSHSVEIRPVSEEISRHRLSFLRRLGTEVETVPRASFDGEVLRLPASLAVFPSRDANAALYIWLTALAAYAPDHEPDDDPLRTDLKLLCAVSRMVRKTLDQAPGLSELYTALCHGSLHQRPKASVSGMEARVEAVVRHMLGDPAELSEQATVLKDKIDSGALDELTAPRGYRPFRPVPVWPDLREVVFSAGDMVENRETDGTAGRSR